MPLIPGRAAYDVSMIGYPTVTVRGRIANPELAGFGLTVMDRDRTAWLRGVAGSFELNGVRKGAATELFVSTRGPRAHVIALTAEQTQADVDLGDITIPSMDQSAAVDITMLNRQDLWGPGIHNLSQSVTLISSDANTILTFWIDRSGRAVTVLQPDPDAPPARPAIPPATYYIVPGGFGSPLDQALLDAVRAAKFDLLDSSHVPTIDAVAGQTTTLSVDARQARDAVIAATRGMGDGPGRREPGPKARFGEPVPARMDDPR